MFGCSAVLEEGGQPDDSALPPEGARFRRKQLSAPPLKKEDKESGGKLMNFGQVVGS